MKCLVRQYRVVPCVALASLPLLITSCATFQSEPVMEIVPPSSATVVRLDLAPGFTTKCGYSARPSRPSHASVRLVDADLRSLHEAQESLLSESRRLPPESRANAEVLAQEWLLALDGLTRDLESGWRTAADDVYNTLVDRVLTAKQRERYYKYQRRGLSREDVWAKIAPSSSQRERIVAMYREALVRTQPVWLASSVFAEAKHESLDALLPVMSDFLSQTEAVTTNINALLTQIEGSEKKYRDAERQIKWLQANLEAEKDFAKQIKLKKAVVDQRAEAEQLRIDTQALQRTMSGYTWKIDDLKAAREAVERRYVVSKAVHDVHVRVLQGIGDLRGKNGAGLDTAYDNCRRELSAAMRLILQNDAGFPESLVSRAGRGMRRLE